MFKEIPGYEGLYEINEYGDVRSIKTGKLKAQGIHNNGYKYVQLWKDNKENNYNIHRLVAITFIPNPLNLPVVMHKDNDKLNCHVSNLKWGTYAENTQQAYADKLFSIPQEHKPYRTYQIYDNERNISEICDGYNGVLEKIGYGTIATIHNAISQNGQLRYGEFKGCRVRKMYKGVTYDN